MSNVVPVTETNNKGSEVTWRRLCVVLILPVPFPSAKMLPLWQAELEALPCWMNWRGVTLWTIGRNFGCTCSPSVASLSAHPLRPFDSVISTMGPAPLNVSVSPGPNRAPIISGPSPFVFLSSLGQGTCTPQHKLIRDRCSRIY